MNFYIKILVGAKFSHNHFLERVGGRGSGIPNHPEKVFGIIPQVFGIIPEGIPSHPTGIPNHPRRYSESSHRYSDSSQKVFRIIPGGISNHPELVFGIIPKFFIKKVENYHN